MGLKTELYKLGFKAKFHLITRPKKAYAVDPITADFFLSMGYTCTPAVHLRKNDLRICSSPLDWVGAWSFDSALTLCRKGFSDVCTEYTEMPETYGPYRGVWDKEYRMIYPHHFRRDISLEEGRNEMYPKMLERFRITEEYLRQADHVVFVGDRINDDLEDIAHFLREMRELYGGRFSAINIGMAKEKSKRVLKTDDDITVYEYSFGDGREKSTRVLETDDDTIVYNYTFNRNPKANDTDWASTYPINYEWRRILGKCSLTGKLKPKERKAGRETFGR